MTRPAAQSALQRPPAPARREGPQRTPPSDPVSRVIAAIASTHMTPRRKRSRTSIHIQRQRFDRAAEHYLRKCYRTNSAARASELAAELGRTPEYLSWLASDVLGMSLRDYLRKKQVSYAAWLLRTLPPEVTVEEVALQAAFGTPKTLYRCFFEAYGTTPGAFRRLKK